MELIRVSSRGQIVIPENVRKRNGIKKGIRLILQERNNELVLKKESDVEKQLIKLGKKEELDWLLVAEKSLAKDWLSPEEDEAWKNL
jgi:AbrB family looped-hinge helix DNA binding protein